MRTLLCASVLAVSAASQAVVIYDSLSQPGAGYTYTTSLPHNFMGDTFDSINADPGQLWNVTLLRLPVVFTTPGTYNMSARVRFYTAPTNGTTGATPAFDGLVSDVTWNATYNNTGTGAVVVTFTLDYLTNNFDFIVGDGSIAGFTVDLRNNNQADQNLTLAMRNLAPNVGTTANGGYYRDADSSGVLTGSDYRSIGDGLNNNVALQVNAEAVPEPATMTLLGLGLAAAALKRRKKA